MEFVEGCPVFLDQRIFRTGKGSRAFVVDERRIINYVFPALGQSPHTVIVLFAIAVAEVLTVEFANIVDRLSLHVHAETVARRHARIIMM